MQAISSCTLCIPIIIIIIIIIRFVKRLRPWLQRHCRQVSSECYSKALWKKYVFSLDLKTDGESALIIVSGNEFQTVGAEQRKAHLTKSVVVNGLSSSGTPDEGSVHSLMRALMWRLRFVGAVALLQLLKVNTATLYSILCWMCNQCSSRSNGWAWDRLGAWKTILAALFCTRCRIWNAVAGAPYYSTELYV